ncbi:MAG: uracil-DNA glycosylase [Eubacteriales bacterium]|nr:uracil-DNA glycosylase [Eubacteriales bacterium]
MVHIGNSWDEVLAEEFQKQYYRDLREFLKYEYSHYQVYPDMYDIFNALKLTAYEDVKAVILGQDPYHGPGQAHGLCFSVKRGVPKPPSLQNIFKELENDLGIRPPAHGCLESWARNGVLLLNTVLTVRAHEPNSHRGKGWEILTDEIIRKLDARPGPMVFILWGAAARSKKALLGNPEHLIIESVHPSPLSASRGFFGGRYFSRTNEFLPSPIDWRID